MSVSKHGLPSCLFNAQKVLEDEHHPEHAALTCELDELTVSTFLERYLAYRMDATPKTSAASLQSQVIGSLTKHLRDTNDLAEELRTITDPAQGLSEGGYRSLLIDPRLPYTILRKLLEARPIEGLGLLTNAKAGDHLPSFASESSSSSDLSGLERIVQESQTYTIRGGNFETFAVVTYDDLVALHPVLQHKIGFPDYLKTCLPSGLGDLDWSNLFLVGSFALNAINDFMCDERLDTPRRDSIKLAVHGLSHDDATKKIESAISVLASKHALWRCRLNLDEIIFESEYYGNKFSVAFLLTHYSSLAEILLRQTELDQVGFDNQGQLGMTPKLALKLGAMFDGVRRSNPFCLGQLESDESSDRGDESDNDDDEEGSDEEAFDLIEFRNDRLFEHLKVAISDRLNVGYQEFGYRNYLTRRIRRTLQFDRIEDLWAKQLTVPLSIPWDLETKVIARILEHSHMELEDVLIPVHDPAKLDPTTATLPPMHDTQDEQGNLRYWLVKKEFALRGYDQAVDEIFAVLKVLHSWWVASGWTELVEQERFQYRTDVKECLYFLAKRCVPRFDHGP